MSLPYAVLHGGYWAIVAMVGIAYICCYTGKILVDCLYELNEEGQLIRVRSSYKGIAREVFGQKWGGKIVNTAQVRNSPSPRMLLLDFHGPADYYYTRYY